MVMQKLKDGFFRAAGMCLRVSFLNFISNDFFRKRATIIFFHSVWKAESGHKVLFGGMDLETFSEELRKLSGFFEFVSLESLLERNDKELPKNPLLSVTFDDGFDLIRTGASQVLEELGIQATTLVNPDSVNYRRVLWQHKFSAILGMKGEQTFVSAFNKIQTKLGLQPIRTFREQIQAVRLWQMSQKDQLASEIWAYSEMPDEQKFLERHRPYFDWSDLKDWIARGHFVGCHTNTHPFCSLLSEEEMRSEIVGAGKAITAGLGLKKVLFAYPFGVRLPLMLEGKLAGANEFSCLLGTAGLSSIAFSPNQLERVETEEGVDEMLFGKPMVGVLKRRIGFRQQHMSGY